MGVFIPTYFSPISQYIGMLETNSIEFEIEDNFQKQSYRNRCYIYGANGKQLLNIPVSHPFTYKKKKTKDTLIEKGSNWQQQHLKSLKSAYNLSPFFEFYIDDLQPIFNKNYKYLLDVNIDTFLFVKDALDLDINYTKTIEYSSSKDDFRDLANAKKKPDITSKPYIQIFDEKYGFIENLSIIDLLFMEGPNSISFLEKSN